ncbi:MAG: TetR/AcrR family transcriptional regulator [Oscillospiraceae bacterium]|jgi:AcrR family transcriptional regulator|nr:TetR/AcrR family transcriptional regulator [Oscillospiraceae bacterium]
MQENQRIRISKQLLQSALIELLGQKNILKISIREICDTAHINRTTFYKYYGSQYDLLADIENGILSQIEKRLKDTSLLVITQLLEFIEENIPICKILLNNNVDPEFPEKLFNLPILKQMVIGNLKDNYSESGLDYSYVLIINGGFAVIKSWINKENRESAVEVAELLCETILRIAG